MENWVWIYENDGRKNNARFILGQVALGKGGSKKPLICFGVNASMAIPKDLDPTVKRVQNIAKQKKEFDGWIMLNLCAWRMTKFKELPKNENRYVRGLHEKNKLCINKILKSYPGTTVWVAWGGLIMERIFLQKHFLDIFEYISVDSFAWKHRGPLVGKLGHPHHPLYLKKNAKFDDFDMKKYSRRLEGKE